MTYASRAAAISQYHRVDVHSGVDSASPHRLIQMLLDGLVARLARARGHMTRSETAAKGEQIGKAISIIETMKCCLDMESGGEVARNLHALYRYMSERLLQANLRNDAAVVSEVEALAVEIKRGWDAIGSRAVAGAARAPDDPAALRASAGSAA